MKQQNIVFADINSDLKSQIIKVFKNFQNEGTLIGDEKRNTIKFVKIDERFINFKSFKKPNIFNRLIYRYLRKSKARRSFEYAHHLLKNNFYTPMPLAYMETFEDFGLSTSFYVSIHLENCLTLRDIMNHSTEIEKVKILEAYTSLMYQLHEMGIEFIDNTAGNFLIQTENNAYKFYLVDLNRMNFHTAMSTSKRLQNLSRLSDDLEILEIISTEYARLGGLKADYCLQKMKQYVQLRISKRNCKRRLKSIIKLKKIS